MIKTKSAAPRGSARLQANTNLMVSGTGTCEFYMEESDKSIAYNPTERVLAAIKISLDSVTKHADHADRWKLTKACTNPLPTESHDKALESLIAFRMGNAAKPIGERQARADILGAYRSQNGQQWDFKTFKRLIRELGGTLHDPETFEPFIEGYKPPESQHKPTDDELFQEALDKVVHASERSSNFMNGRNGDSSWNRNTALSHAMKNFKDIQAHPYVLKKGIQVNGPAINSHGTLMVPMTNAIWPDHYSGWQSIDDQGNKLFMAGQPTIGQYYPIGQLHDTDLIVVCEGMATGESIHEATGLPVACALGLHNILPVAASLLWVEADIQARRILIAADTGHDEQMKKYVRILRSEVSDYRAGWVAPMGVI